MARDGIEMDRAPVKLFYGVLQQTRYCIQRRKTVFNEHLKIQNGELKYIISEKQGTSTLKLIKKVLRKTTMPAILRVGKQRLLSWTITISLR